MRYIENKTFDELKVGDMAEITRTLHKQDIELFAVLSGDVNPAHLDEAYAKTDMFHRVIAHGMWGGALISAVIGTELPGPGSIYLDQTLSFRKPVGIGDTVTIRVTVLTKQSDTKRVTLSCVCLNQAHQLVIQGEALVIAPTEKVRRPRALLPEIHIHEHGARYRELISAAQKQPPIRTAVVQPCDDASLRGALDASEAGLMTAVLIGQERSIRATAEGAHLSLNGIEIVDAPDDLTAARQAVALARSKSVGALMKGAIQTHDLMSAILAPEAGLRTGRRMSHVYALDVPNYPKPLLVADAAINISPDLTTKRDIIQNAIDLAHALGIPCPKVAILAAIETVSEKFQSTVDAAALCKMADRGQILGGVLDGPLAFDNAVSPQAAKSKHITSHVAGDADVLIAPDLEAANMIAKQLIYLAGAEAAGLVLGARVPIILTSRADTALTRIASCALALLYVSHKRLAS